MNKILPKWHLELDRFRAFKTTFILEGNIFDLHGYPQEKEGHINWIPCSLDQYLNWYLTGCGYSTIVFYNHIDGFYNTFDGTNLVRFLSSEKEKNQAVDAASEKGNTDNTLKDAEPKSKEIKPYEATIPTAASMIRRFLANRYNGAKAVILNMASLYTSSPDNLNVEERHSYSKLFLAAQRPTQVASENGFLNNLLLIVVNKANDIPAWFYLDNPYLKTITVSKPDRNTRMRFIDTQLKFFYDWDKLDEKDLGKCKERFVDLTEGFKNIELNGLKVLCRQEGIPLARIPEAINLYKYGIKENPWDDESIKDKLDRAEEEIKKRVKGQGPAIVQTLDIIKRAGTGLSGLQHSSGSSKPKGILFFAGPTGTGKTEMARALASHLFGDEKACTRFDMSEFQQGHSDQKLLGAPPGYVGYEAGGQLTNAVKERPFSILLFDEIEKAHPSIFDKFLQILEDGRMTDGRGDTVYFSESIIIFTSNLGIYRMNENGRRVPNVTMEITDYDEIRTRIISSIKEYFILELGRPEILNRIGDNFVVFDYIRPDVAHQIIDAQLEKITGNFKENKNIKLIIDQKAKDYITGKALGNLENGGRGIGNIIEKHLINPLARYIADNKVTSDCTLTVKEIVEKDNVSTSLCEVTNGI